MRTLCLVIVCMMVAFAPERAKGGRLLLTEPLDCLTPQGWLGEMMRSQERNFTGILDNTAFPFTQGGWGAEPFLRVKNGVTEEFWVPYEQTAYYFDGMIRLAHLLHSASLLDKAQKTIYQTIAQAGDDGFSGPRIVSEDMARWVYAVFFRGLMAEYEATYNEKIIKALDCHYRNDTVRYTARSLCNIEVFAPVTPGLLARGGNDLCAQ